MKNNIKFGGITDPSKDIIKEIKLIKEMGFDFVEVGIEGPGAMPDMLIKKKKQIRKLLKEFNTPAIAHTMWYADIGTPHDTIKKAWLKQCKKLIKTAKKLGIGQITFHLICKGMFIYTKKSRKQVFNNFVKSYRELVKYGKKYGVKVTVENGVELGSTGEINYVLSKVSGLGFLLDIGHVNVNGGMKGIEKTIKKFGKRIDHIHVHDNHGMSDDHLPIGRGTINYKKVVQLLKQIKYNKTITLEVFPDKDSQKHSMKKIKRMW